MQSPPPTEYFPGIQFNPYYYQSWNEPVTKLYVDTNFLKCVGYAYSRAIATSFSGIINADGGIQTTNINATGTITSNLFSGSGASLSSLNASNISTGTLTVARGGTGANTFPAKRILLGDGTNPINTTSNLVYDTSTNTLLPINIEANGSGLTNLNASNISTGTLAVARGGTGANTLPLNRVLICNNTSSIFSTSLLTWDPTTDTLNGKFVGSGNGLTNLNADNFISGVLDVNFGGTGVNSFIADRLLIGGTAAISQSGNLTWTTATNILTATNFSGDGSRITNLNVSNSSAGTLAVNRGGTGATTFTAGRLLIGNSTSAITEDPELTWNGTTNILTVSGTGAITTVSATNIGIGITNPTTSSIEIVRPVTTATDLINMRYDATNGLRINQAYVAANDVKQIFIQKNNNVDTNTLTFYRGNVGIGMTAPAATDRLSITGNTKITGTATIDTNLVVGGSAGIIGTGNFTGNVGIGTGTIATNVLVVGAGGRLRIANGTTDYTLIGTSNTDALTNPRIIIFGNTHATLAGFIQYCAPTTAGSHIFYTEATQIERMTISSTGVNINNNLGASGNVGFGVAPSATHKLNVLGSANVSGVYRINGSATCWLPGATTTNIYYNLGNVSIGTTTTSDIDDNSTIAIPTARLNIRGGETTGGTCDVVIRGGVAGQINGKARLWLAGDASHASFIESEHVGAGSTQLWFATALANNLPTKRMVIDQLGIVLINPFDLDNGQGKFLVSGSDANGVSAYFYHPNRTQGIGITYDGLRALGYNANQNIVMRPRGTGTFQVEGTGMSVSNYITAGSYILSSNYIIMRNGFDAVLYCDSGQMRMSFGDVGTGNSTYLEISASGGITNFNSGSARNIYFRCNGYRWVFANAGESYNAANTTSWTAGSDQRIKENIKKSNLKICYDNVKNINLYRYNYIDGFNKGTQHDKTQLGFIAQQVQQHFPKSVTRSKMRIEDKRELPDFASVNIDQINFTLFGAVKQLIKVVEKQSKRIKKLEELLNIIDDDEIENDADEPYEKIICDEVDIETIKPSEPQGV
jgi:hypothetical protein